MKHTSQEERLSAVLQFNPQIPLAEAETPPSSWYLSEDFFQLEKEAVFMRGWVGIGDGSTLQQAGDFITGELIDEPYVVVNNPDASSTPLAFFNVCPHKAGREDNDRTWDGWHTDYSLLTALTHPLYWDAHGERIDCPQTSLWIKDRTGSAHEVVMPEDSLLVLPSNAMMILSGGLIPATAHQVLAGQGVPRYAHRSTLASFFQPQPDFPLAIPGGRSLAEIKAGSYHMSDFFEEGLTYGTYSDRLLDYLLTRPAPASPASS
ncbi:MAG: hypothetical protein ACKO6N_27950 [Myxococcota bacterium]